jgi:mycoredoxin
MIKVYGADWCGDTKRTLRYLDNLDIDYEYIDVEQDEAASEWVKSHNEGKERKPTLMVGSQILSVPSEDQLKAAIESENKAKK